MQWCQLLPVWHPYSQDFLSILAFLIDLAKDFLVGLAKVATSFLLIGGEASLGDGHGVYGGKATKGKGWGVAVLRISTSDSWVLDGEAGLGGEIGVGWG